MRKFLLAVAASAGLFASLAPIVANAETHANCDTVPKAEWAKCVMDQAADQASQ